MLWTAKWNKICMFFITYFPFDISGISDASFPIKDYALDFFLFDVVFQTGLIFFKRLSLAGGIMRLRIR